MGRTRMFPCRIEFLNPEGFYYTSWGWSGRASAAKFTAYMEAFIDSMQPGGVNAHLATGRYSAPLGARLVKQPSDPNCPVVVAEWTNRRAEKAPLFTVYDAA